VVCPCDVSSSVSQTSCRRFVELGLRWIWGECPRSALIGLGARWASRMLIGLPLRRVNDGVLEVVATARRCRIRFQSTTGSGSDRRGQVSLRGRIVARMQNPGRFALIASFLDWSATLRVRPKLASKKAPDRVSCGERPSQHEPDRNRNGRKRPDQEAVHRTISPIATKVGTGWFTRC
jgi:hypothetical protein